jgi:hypothetical protein
LPQDAAPAGAAIEAHVDGLLKQITSAREQNNEAALRRLFTAHPTFSVSVEADALALERMGRGGVPHAARNGAARIRPSARLSC